METNVQSSVKRFVLKRLFGIKDVELSFENQVQIFVGENGLGKTTVLNALYYVLSSNYQKLSKINFGEIEIEFGKRKFIFSKQELEFYIDIKSNEKESGFYEYLQNKLSPANIKELNKIIKKKIGEDEITSEVLSYLRKINVNIGGPSSYIYKNVSRYVIEKETAFEELKNYIKSTIKSEILYFPTYRRIEEELQNLGNFINKKDRLYHQRTIFDEVEMEDNSVIQFGMQDVEFRIKKITQTISQSSLNGFAKVSGRVLSQLLKGYPDEISMKNIAIEDIRIILGRVGNNLSIEDKDSIIEMVNSKKIFDKQNKELVYFLDQLLELYKSQQKYDTAIKNFKDTCNGYLVDKHYEYNESTVELNIYRNGSEKEIVLLSQLSSGEKQIVSLFSKIYLQPETSFIVLFDEPELSLSIFWQKQLLPDILKSGRCEFLLAVTHSPFIFENDLRQHTIGLKEFITKSK